VSPHIEIHINKIRKKIDELDILGVDGEYRYAAGRLASFVLIIPIIKNP